MVYDLLYWLWCFEWEWLWMLIPSVHLTFNICKFFSSKFLYLKLGWPCSICFIYTFAEYRLLDNIVVSLSSLFRIILKLKLNDQTLIGTAECMTLTAD